jgi:hypothetical protein
VKKILACVQKIFLCEKNTFLCDFEVDTQFNYMSAQTEAKFIKIGKKIKISVLCFVVPKTIN